MGTLICLHELSRTNSRGDVFSHWRNWKSHIKGGGPITCFSGWIHKSRGTWLVCVLNDYKLSIWVFKGLRRKRCLKLLICQTLTKWVHDKLYFISSCSMLAGHQQLSNRIFPLCLSFELMNVRVMKVIIVLLDDSEAQAERVELRRTYPVRTWQRMYRDVNLSFTRWPCLKAFPCFNIDSTINEHIIYKNQNHALQEEEHQLPPFWFLSSWTAVSWQ